MPFSTAIYDPPSRDATTVYSIGLTGDVAPAGGVRQYVAQHRFVAAATPSGSILKSIARRLTAGLTPSGILANSKIALKSIAGTVASAGALIKMPKIVKTGAVTSAGSIPLRTTAKRITGALTPTAVVRKQVQRRLTAALTSSGTVAHVKLLLRSFSGALTPSGAIVRQVQKRLTAALTPSGILSKSIARRLPAVSTPTGAVTNAALVLLHVAGTVASAGVLTRRALHSFAGSLAPGGAVTKAIARRLTATAASSGTLASAHTIARSFAGSVASNGTVRRSVQIVRGGVLTATGSIPARAITQRLFGFLTPIGNFVKQHIRPPSGTGAVAEALRELVNATDPGVPFDLAGTVPFYYRPEPERWYLWETDDRRSSRSSDRTRQDFDFTLAYVIDDQGEEAAMQDGKIAVSTALDDTAQTVLAAIRQNHVGDKWDHIEASYEPDFVLSFGMRGFAIRVRGYRLL